MVLAVMLQVVFVSRADADDKAQPDAPADAPPHKFKAPLQVGRNRAQIRAVVKLGTLTEDEAKAVAVALAKRYEPKAGGAYLVGFLGDAGALEKWDGDGLFPDGHAASYLGHVIVDTNGQGQLFARLLTVARDPATDKARADAFRKAGDAAKPDAKDGKAAPAGKPRLSADDKELPEAVAKAIDVPLPLGRVSLGALPEDFGRVYSMTSKLAVAKEKPWTNAGEWFVTNRAGVPITAFTLTDGRVRAAHLGYGKMTDGQLDQLIRQIEAGADATPKGKFTALGSSMSLREGMFNFKGVPVWVLIREEREKGALKSVIVNFEMFTWEWYIHHHKPSDALAATMRKRELVKDMPYAAAIAVFGLPTKVDKVPLFATEEFREREQGDYFVHWKAYYKIEKPLVGDDRKFGERTIVALVRNERVIQFVERRD